MSDEKKQQFQTDCLKLAHQISQLTDQLADLMNRSEEDLFDLYTSFWMKEDVEKLQAFARSVHAKTCRLRKEEVFSFSGVEPDSPWRGYYYR